MAKKKNPSMALALPELPEDIQRKIILSLPPKAFARSSILSKSWLSFYNSTRCSFNLDFKFDKNRVPQGLQQEIMNFDESLSASLLREKLTVDEFNINMKLDRYLDIPQHYSDKLRDVVYKWLAALFTTNNIVKVLWIQIQTSGAIGKFYMPPEIFSNGSLQILHIQQNCILDLVYPINLGCLRVLSLRWILIDDKSTNVLLTACPNLEQLTWEYNHGVQHIIIKGLHKLKHLDITGLEDVRIQDAPALENVSVMPACDDRAIINAQACRRIKLLTMSVNSETTARHIQQIVSCLPALENLELCVWYAADIIISSLCLKNLHLHISEDPSLIMVKIIAPNLRCYKCCSDSMIRQLMMKTGMLERIVIQLAYMEIDYRLSVQELRKALRMIEHFKLGVDTINIKLRDELVRVNASRLDEKLNIPATRVIEMLDAGAVKFDVHGKFCF